MAEAKTKPTTQSVAATLEAIDDEARRKDCKALAALMKRVTGCAPVLEQLLARAVAETKKRYLKTAT